MQRALWCSRPDNAGQTSMVEFEASLISSIKDLRGECSGRASLSGQEQCNSEGVGVLQFVSGVVAPTEDCSRRDLCMKHPVDCYLFDIDGTLADVTHRLHHIETKP